MSDRTLYICAVLLVLAAPIYATCKLVHAGPPGHSHQPGCGVSARWLRYACAFDTRDDLYTAIAKCEDSSVVDGKCLVEARSEYREASEECGAVLEARMDICDALDDDVHDPMFGPDFSASFVDPSEIGSSAIPNPYFPLVPGNRWVYEGAEETITVVVTTRTKLIDSIHCVVVNDLVVDEDGSVVENTDDWYAQDVQGNVWYCGEVSREFERFEGDVPEEPEILSLDGSWKAGRNGAKAGILIPAAPEVGVVIRQELLYGEAEDVIEIVAIDATASAPGGSCDGDCLETRDFTALEPDNEEKKFYAPGIGLIVEIDPESGERLELTEVVWP